MKLKFLQTQFQTQKESLKIHLDRLLIIISFLLIIFCSTISNILFSDVEDKWSFTLNIYRLSFLLIFFVGREIVIKSIGTHLYRVVLYLLINHFIDRYFQLNTWSINDALTLIAVGFEYVIHRVKIKKL